MKAWLVAFAALTSSACASIREDHYFEEPVRDGSGARNYFRLRVRGRAGFARARYVAGYYDERAVDMYFNEVKPASGSEDVVRPIFGPEPREPGGEVFKPLSPPEDRGAFVMILSTNAKVVADVIGQFAESQVVSDAITNIVNRDALKEARGAVAAFDAEVKASEHVASELETLHGQVAAATPQPGYLAMLNAIARHFGRSEGFTHSTVAEAREWLEREEKRR